MGNRGGDAGRFSETDEANNMSTLTIQLPESLKKTIEKPAAQEGYSVSQFLASAAGEKLAVVLTMDYLDGIKVSDLKSGAIIFGYSVHKGNSARGRQSAGEACAKHLKQVVID